MKSNGLLLLVAGLLIYSCSAENISGNYYFQYQKELDSIKHIYRSSYKQQPFSLSFTDRDFRTISLEIHTDSLTYIYDFSTTEPRLRDTLFKYHLQVNGITQLIGLMHSIRCTWVNNFDYYTDDQKKSLIFISVKPVRGHSFFNSGKYYILTYYSQRQYFDKEGRLLDKWRLRRLRKINGDIFRRINDSVCYTISGQYR